MAISMLIGATAALAWCVVLLLPSRPYLTRERLNVAGSVDRDLSHVTVLVPARDEAATIDSTISGLARQGHNLTVNLVDDQSVDGTAQRALDQAAGRAPWLHLNVYRGSELPVGWGGKLWALQQAFTDVESEWVLLIDADIELAPGTVSALLDQAAVTGSDLVSVMADLRCRSAWERLLVPPFIYFFKLLYPFARVADARSTVAAAAGGCVLVRTKMLRAIGAFSSFSDALIDDCTLARKVKQQGGRLWLGLCHAVISNRRYDSYAEFATMVVRTAFTQLRYSSLLLLLVSLLMVLVFFGPFVALIGVSGIPGVAIFGLGVGAMSLAYWPVLRWYRRPLVAAAALPLAAALYLAMTWQSAIRFWAGTRASWKGRNYVSG